MRFKGYMSITDLVLLNLWKILTQKIKRKITDFVNINFTSAE